LRSVAITGGWSLLGTTPLRYSYNTPRARFMGIYSIVERHREKSSGRSRRWLQSCPIEIAEKVIAGRPRHPKSWHRRHRRLGRIPPWHCRLAWWAS